MKKIISLILITLFFCCKTDNKNSSNLVNDSESTPQKPEQKLDQTFEEKYVTAKSGLNYRKQPKGAVIGKFDYAQKVQIIHHSAIFETITDNGDIKKGEWLGVKVNKDTVYTFGAYLSKDKISDLNNKTIKNQEKGNLTNILLPFTYRDWENKNPADNLNKNWFELNEKESKYYISKANYTIKTGEDACTGSATKTITSKNKTLLYINNSKLHTGDVYSIDFDKDKIWPNEKITFNYKDITYAIRAEGDILSTEQGHTDNGSERNSVVENYKLYISTSETSESLFLEQKSFNDTFVRLLFVGDIDSDDTLDFIFEANRHYEEKRVILYLSTTTNKTEIIKKAAEIAISFDC